MYSVYFISAFARKLWRGEHCWSGHTSALVVGFHCQFMVKIATLVDALMSFATWCHHLVKDNKASARLAIEVLMQGADSHKLSISLYAFACCMYRRIASRVNSTINCHRTFSMYAFACCMYRRTVSRVHSTVSYVFADCACTGRCEQLP